jgi:2-methylisocitrate lyase-like PEP mutase family enzyme
MTDEVDLYDRFLALHTPGTPLLIPNPWDLGSAKILESLGFQALATTSSGFAATLGRLDGTVTRDEALTHVAQLCEATSVPVSADLEHAFADDPAGVSATVSAAIAVGAAGCSIEDSTGRRDDPIYEASLARERVEAAVEAAHSGARRLVLTARAEGYLHHDQPDLDDVIARLQSFQEAGADVLYAPGLTDLEEIRRVVSSLDRPVNVLAVPKAPSVAELAEAGVARISVGGGFAYAALGGLVKAAQELMTSGTYGYWEGAAAGRAAVRSALG